MAAEAETIVREGKMMKKIPCLLGVTGTEAFAFNQWSPKQEQVDATE